MKLKIFLLLLIITVRLWAQYTNIGETGNISAISNVWVTVNLKNVYHSDYVVIARPVSYNGSDPVVARISNKTTNSFMIKLQEPVCNDGTHITEQLSFVVIKTGKWYLPDGTKIEAHLYDSSSTVGRNVGNVWDTQYFSHNYLNTPVVISMVQTYNDPNFVSTRHQNIDANSFNIAMEEEENQTTQHGTETIGWIAIEKGTGVNNNKYFESDYTPDSVSSSWYTINFLQTYSEIPCFFAMMATYDGPDNSHTRRQSLTTSSVQIKVEEDTCNDSETGHTTEVIGYICWESSSNIVAVKGGVISISIGDNTPSQNLLSTGKGQEIMQFKILPEGSENYTNVRLTINARGTGDDSVTVLTNIELWLDVNNNGFLDPSIDVKIDSTNYNSDNGKATFNLGTLTNNKVYIYLLVYDITNATSGSTYYAVISNNNIEAYGEITGNSPYITGGPVTGNELTVVESYNADVIGEVGRLIHFATNEWQTVSLANTYTNPVVVVGAPEYRDSDPCVVRISNVQSNSFMIKLQEPANLDGIHQKETIHYMVIEAGLWVLPDGTVIEAGKTNISNTIGLNVTGGSFASIRFNNNFSSPPSVISSVMSYNDSAFVKTRHNGVTTTNFNVALEEAENATGFHGTETIGWIAFGTGTGENFGNKYESGRTPDQVTDSFYSHSFTQNFLSSPVVLAWMETYDGNNNSETRIQTPQVNSFASKIEEDTTYDGETSHTTEVVDYIAWESPGRIYIPKGNVIFVEKGDASPAGNLLSYGNNQEIFQFILKVGGKEQINNVNLTLHALGTGDDSSNIISLVSLYTDKNKNGLYEPSIDGLIGTGTYTGDNGTITFNLGDLPANSTNIYLITYNINNAKNGDTFAIQITAGDITGTGANSGESPVIANTPVTSYTLRVMASAGMGIGEAGVLSEWVTTNWQTVYFHRNYTSPVIVARPLSFNESDPVAVRIRNVTSSNFEIKLQEPSNEDQAHIAETVGYIVVEEGSYTLPDGKRLIAGKITTNITCGDSNPGANFATVNFGYTFSSPPAVIHQVMSYNDPQWVKTRANGVTTTSFKVALEEEEAQTGYHGTETIGWIAIETGTGTNNGILFEAGRTGTVVDEVWYTINFNQNFISPSIFLANLETYYGSDPCNCRYRNLTPDSVEILGQEDTSSDSEQNHVDEIADYIVFESPGDIIGTTNLPVNFIFSKASNSITNQYFIKNQTNIKVLSLYFTNTNSNGNDVQITGIYLRLEDKFNNDITPSSAISKVKVTGPEETNIYVIKTNIENTGSEIFIDLFPANLYIPVRTAKTCLIFVDITTNLSATNIRFEITSSNKITAMDLFFHSNVTNRPISGFNFPFQTKDADIVNEFKIFHDTLAYCTEWEPVEIRIMDFKQNIITNFTELLTLDTDGDTNAIEWTNITGNGYFSNAGGGSDKAYYKFDLQDKGIVTLYIKDTTEETITVISKNSFLTCFSNNLRFIYPYGKIELNKYVNATVARPYDILLYEIKYTNITGYTCWNFHIVESLPTNVYIITNSAEKSNQLHAGNVTVYYSTDYSSSNWFDSGYDDTNSYKIRKIKWEFDTPVGGHEAGIVRFKVIIK